MLKPWEGEAFEAVVLTVKEKTDDHPARARIFVAEPPLLAQCVGDPEQGSKTTVTLVTADPEKREVTFAWPAD